MAKIKIELNGAYSNGKQVTFKAPCNCSAVDGLRVSYPKRNGLGFVESVVDFTFRDAAGNDLAGLGNLFTEGAYVSAILDTDNKCAYLQNPNTNEYLENEFAKLNSKFGFNERDIKTISNKLVAMLGNETFTSVFTKGANYSSFTGGVTRIGNLLRININAERTSKVSGNIDNEIVGTIKISHNNKISSWFNSCAGIGGSGHVSAFYTDSVKNSDGTYTCTVWLSATAGETNSFSSYLLIPIALNMDAF